MRHFGFACIFFLITAIAFGQIAPKTILSVQGGYYSDSVIVAITCSAANANIHYTLDGTTPAQSDPMYTGPLTIQQNNSLPDNFATIPTNPSFSYPKPGFSQQRADDRGWLPPYSSSQKITVLKSRAFINGYYSSPDSCAVATFIIGPSLQNAFTLPVLSISADSADFFSASTGIYVYGNDTVNAGNYGTNATRKIHIEFFDTNGVRAVAQFCDVRIHGGGSRHAPQKSLQLIAQQSYGSKYIDYRFFPSAQTKRFSRLLLRNGGHRPDCMPRDDIAGDFLQTLDNAVQHARQCIVFLNGEFWGIQTIKETMDDNYLSNKYGWKNPYSTILAQTGTLDEGLPGDEISYADLMNFIQTNDLTQSANYNHVWEVVDRKTFVDFQCANIFLGNGDWPANNTKFWRFKYGPNFPGANNVTDGRWRWMIYDLDAGFGGDCDAPSVNFNVLDDALNSAYGSYTRLLRKLIINDSFKIYFINRFADLLNSDFLPAKLYSSVQKTTGAFNPYILLHVNRWRYPSDSTTLAGRLFEPPTTNKWNSIVSYLSSFTADRARKTRNQFMSYFSLADTLKITIDINDTTMGKIKVNSIFLDSDLPRSNTAVYPWTGVYFNGNPVTATACAKPGFRFKNWGGISDTAYALTFNAHSDTLFTAFFEADTAYNPVHYLFINEVVSANQAGIFDEAVEHEDWIELYNPHNFSVDLKGFYLSDDPLNKMKFRINARSEISSISPKEHFVLWADDDSTEGKLHLNFKLSAAGAEYLFLSDPLGRSVDSVFLPALPTDYSFGRNADGNNDWITFKYPTPNKPNQITEDPDKETFYVWPNPAMQNSTLVLSQRRDIELYDMCGKLLRKMSNVKYLGLAGLSKGVYIIRSSEGSAQKFVIN